MKRGAKIDLRLTADQAAALAEAARQAANQTYLLARALKRIEEAMEKAREL